MKTNKFLSALILAFALVAMLISVPVAEAAPQTPPQATEIVVQAPPADDPGPTVSEAMKTCTEGMDAGVYANSLKGLFDCVNDLLGGAATPPQPQGACTDPSLIVGPVRFALIQNHDVGDGVMHAILYAKNATGDSFVAVVESGWSLDFEAPFLTGEFSYYTGDLAAVECTARQLAKLKSAGKLLWVGENPAADWNTDTAVVLGFTLHANQPFADDKVDTGAAEWVTKQFSRTDAQTWGDSTSFTTVQGWDGSDSTVVFHFIIEPGYRLVRPIVSVSMPPELQGTAWLVSNGDSATVMARFAQMSEEVVSRDGPTTVNRIFCGASATTFPVGWLTQGHAWVCEEMR